MGRKSRTGVDFYPQDVDHFEDIKIMRLLHKHQAWGYVIYWKAVSLIYKHGYYLEWEEDTAFFIASNLNITEGQVEQVINYCLEIGLFNKPQFEQNSILTSASIQERWQTIVVNAKRKNTTISDNFRINSGGNAINSGGNAINSGGNAINSGVSTQSKVKESKVKERKEELGAKAPLSASPDVDGENHSVKKSEAKDPIPYQSFVDAWNQTYKTKVRLTAQKKAQIRGRLKTFKPEEILQAMINRTHDHWLNNDGIKFLTDWNAFWRNDEKIERYLNTKIQNLQKKPRGNNERITTGQAFEELYFEQRDKAFNA